jgi:SAM-dependent methyltransferase
METRDERQQVKLIPTLAMILVLAAVFTLLGYRIGVELERDPNEGWVESSQHAVEPPAKTAEREPAKSKTAGEGAVKTAPKQLLHGPVLAKREQVDDPYLKQYEFTRDAFTDKLPIWEKALEPFKGRENLRYLEIGLFEGRSALWMLEQVLTHATSKLVGIDPFGDPYGVEDVEGRFYSNLKLSGAEKRVEVIKGFPQIELRKLPLESFDVIYIDGSHRGLDVLEDAILSYRLLKNGGLLMFDDYLWHIKGPHKSRPQKAIEAFYYFYGEQFEIVHADYQVILRRELPTPSE